MNTFSIKFTGFPQHRIPPSQPGWLGGVWFVYLVEATQNRVVVPLEYVFPGPLVIDEGAVLTWDYDDVAQKMNEVGASQGFVSVDLYDAIWEVDLQTGIRTQGMYFTPQAGKLYSFNVSTGAIAEIEGGTPMQGTFYLSVINYPYGPPYQPNTPICTLFAIQYWDNATGTWGHFTPWTGIYNPVQITCNLDNIAVIAYVGNSDPNDPNSPMTIPTDGSTISPTGVVADGGHYRLNLNARTGQNGLVVFEAGDWEPGQRVGGNNSLLIGATILGVGIVALAISSKKR